MTESILILTAVSAGVFFQRIVGFGMPIIVFPVTLAFFNPASALVIALLTGIISSLMVAYHLKSMIRFGLGIVKTIIPVSIIGILIGAYILTIINKGALQVFLGLSIILSLNIQRYFLPKPKEKLKRDGKMQAYGLLSGFFNSTVGLSAAPLLMWIRFYKATSDQVRIVMAFSFIFMNSISVISIQALNSNTLSSIPMIIFTGLLPAIYLANLLGAWAAAKVSEPVYDKVAYIVLISAGILTLVAGVNGLLIS